MNVTTVNTEQFRDRILFTLTPHRWGNRAKIKDAGAFREYLRLKDLPKGSAESNGNGIRASNNGKGVSVDRTSSTKQLIDSPALDAINEAMTELKDRLVGKIRGLANPSFLARGIYSIRKDLVPTVEKMIADTDQKIKTSLRPALEDEYPIAVDKARDLPPNEGGLGPIFDSTDYPDASEVAKKFWLEWSYLQLGVAEDLPAELREKKLAEFNQKLQDAYEETINALRVGFAELVEHATEKLTCAPGEKPKVFRDTLIGNIDDFINAFAARNMGDAALEKLVEKAKALVRPNGEMIDPDRLRKSANVRENMREGFAKIQQELDGMIVAQKSRKIDLSEDE